MNEPGAPQDPTRDHKSLTAAAEKRLLIWLAHRMPAWLNSDHLTALGLLGNALAGIGYALAGRDPLWLHFVNLCLFVNWFGDSLDGTVARVRKRPRPRYGFYVDHLVDAFGALFLLLGLAMSGLVSERVALALLVVYFLFSINMYLATVSLGVFKISYGLVGGTELRILLAAVNLVVLSYPRVPLFDRTFLLFDLIAGLGAV
ncbi:MAG TPA: CDP-alcohol phosphatidyltransferase family protein, partial [Vicinamibacteria bacterium]